VTPRSWVEDTFNIRKEKSYKMQQSIKIFIVPYLYEAQHVLGDKTARHQEPKTAQAAFGFSYVEGCLTCS
jgi:hypothetical protein